MTRFILGRRCGQFPAVMILLLLLLSVVATGTGTAQDATTKPCGPMACAAGPKIIAVKFHADWCGYCKAMGPVFEELQAKFDREPVLYVTFDQTREFNRRQSRYLAHAMGLDCVWKENGGKTGFVLLIDPRTHKVVKKLTHDQSLKQMGAAIRDAVQSTS